MTLISHFFIYCALIKGCIVVKFQLLGEKDLLVAVYGSVRMVNRSRWAYLHSRFNRAPYNSIAYFGHKCYPSPILFTSVTPISSCGSRAEKDFVSGFIGILQAQTQREPASHPFTLYPL